MEARSDAQAWYLQRVGFVVGAGAFHLIGKARKLAQGRVAPWRCRLAAFSPGGLQGGRRAGARVVSIKGGGGWALRRQLRHISGATSHGAAAVVAAGKDGILARGVCRAAAGARQLRWPLCPAAKVCGHKHRGRCGPEAPIWKAGGGGE